MGTVTNTQVTVVENYEVGQFEALIGESHEFIALYPYRNIAGDRIVGFRAYFKPNVWRAFAHDAAWMGGLNKQNKAVSSIDEPYNLSQIVSAASRGEAIHCFDDELDCAIAERLHLSNTTLAAGNANRIVKYIEDLNPQESPWFIWHSENAKARSNAYNLAHILHRHGFRVKVAEVPLHGEFKKWKPTLEEVQDVLVSTRQWFPESEQLEMLAGETKLPRSSHELDSEAFGGEYYASLYSNQVKYVSERGKWYAFNGKVWEVDYMGLHHQLAKTLAIKLKKDRELMGDHVGRKFTKLADRLESSAGKDSVLRMAITEPALSAPLSAFDGRQTDDLLTCENGVVDLRTGEILKHSPARLITRRSPFVCDTSGKDPVKFLAFINRLFQDGDVEAWVLKFLGYCLTGNVGWQHFCAWVGKPNSGKSQLVNIMRGLLGSLAGHLDASSLYLQDVRSPGADSDLAGTVGARVIFTSEIRDAVRLDETTIKALSGEDVLKVKFMGKDKFPLQSCAKMVFTANAPLPLSSDSAIARRLVDLRFEYPIPPNEVIESYGEKLLREEGPLILGLLVQMATTTYKPDALALPAKMQTWKEQAVDAANPLNDWYCGEHFAATRAGLDAWISGKEVRKHFDEWCEEGALKPDISRNKFNDFLRDQGAVRTKRHCWGWRF